jgi:hypothetical protein
MPKLFFKYQALKEIPGVQRIGFNAWELLKFISKM